MSSLKFFNPTPIYKEYLILDLIEHNQVITQREISHTIGIAVSMVNSYLDEYENRGYIYRIYISPKNVKYCITKMGSERRKLLNIWYLKASHEVYLSAKNNITSFLSQLVERGFRKIFLYGAGEVAEIILDVIKSDKEMNLEVIAVIDDNPEKQNNKILDTNIVGNNYIKNYAHDGILISSYSQNKEILQHLLNKKYDVSRIIQFFE